MWDEVSRPVKALPHVLGLHIGAMRIVWRMAVDIREFDGKPDVIDWCGDGLPCFCATGG